MERVIGRPASQNRDEPNTNDAPNSRTPEQSRHHHLGKDVRLVERQDSVDGLIIFGPQGRATLLSLRKQGDGDRSVAIP